MQTNLLPFNIDLLILSDQDIKAMRPVKVLDITDGFSSNFHPDGLYSIEIFGKVGEERRNRLYSYVDMNISILHPIIYKTLCELKELYGGILTGKVYAVFNKELNDFEKSDPIDGKTGYSFFLDHLDKLKFEERPSSKREFNIKLITKYKDKCLLDKLIILPAGMRDYIIDTNGKPSEDEINKLYRKVISLSSMTSNVNTKTNSSYLDNIRNNLQIAVNEIYDYIKSLLEGKSKLILGKWASRKIFNSTRNVITSHIPTTSKLHGINTVKANQTIIGLYQYLRNILPLAIKQVRDDYLSRVFTGPNTPAILVNKKTLKKEMVNLDPKYYDKWMTYEGLEKIMASFGEENLRHEPLLIDDYYLGLIYKGKDGTFKFLQDIDELPEGRSPEDVSPITYTELLYISVYKGSEKIPGLFTRYPITGYGSIYPCYMYLKTTINSEVRKELDDNWNETGDLAIEFPLKSSTFYNSMSPAVGHLKRLTADNSKVI